MKKIKKELSLKYKHKLLKGKDLEAKVLDKLKNEIINSSIKAKPGLKIIMVGNDQASKVYVEKKIEAGTQIGINVTLNHFKQDSTE